MTLRGRDIICLSTHYWDERWFRKQEFMSRFARENRVLFVEPSFSMARRPEEHLAAHATNRPLLPTVERRGERIHLLKPPRGLPKWSDPRIERATYRWFGRSVARAARRLGFRDAILWTYRPSYAVALDAIPHAQLVMDLVDDLAAYGHHGDAYSTHVDESVRTVIGRSDLLVVTAKTLADRYGELARRVEHVPNGFAAEVFGRDAPRARPAALEGLRGPLLGFVGTLFSFLDFELMEAVARRHDDKTLVLVGPVEANAHAAVQRLEALPNVVHVGAQPRTAVPDFVAAFDVCLNPFLKSRVADSVNPLKVYEYLALGRAVVSTPMRALELEPAAAAVAFAEGADAFNAAIDRCLAEDGEAARERRRAIAAPYSWEKLFERLDAACAEALPAPR